MACSEGQNLKLQPLPTAVRGKWPVWNVCRHAIPQAQGFLANQYATKEILGAVLQKIGWI